MNLKAWLRKHKRGQAAFAAAAGISQGHVSKLAARKCRRVSAELALKVERATRGAVKVKDLVHDDNA